MHSKNGRSSQTVSSQKPVAASAQQSEPASQAKNHKKTSLLSRNTPRKERQHSPSLSESSSSVPGLHDTSILRSLSDPNAPISPPPFKELHDTPSSSVNAWRGSQSTSNQEQRKPPHTIASKSENTLRNEKDSLIIAPDSHVQAKAETARRMPMTDALENCGEVKVPAQQVALFPVTHEKSVRPKKHSKLSLSRTRRQKQQQQSQQQ